MGDSTHLAIDAAYAEAIGRATYAFAVMEWNAIWCCEVLGEREAAELGNRTAGVVADEFKDLARREADPDLRTALVGAGQRFHHLVRVRNALAHGEPGRSEDGRAILVHEGRPWTLDGILGAAQDFAECSARLENLLNGPLRGR